MYYHGVISRIFRKSLCPKGLCGLTPTPRFCKMIPMMNLSLTPYVPVRTIPANATARDRMSSSDAAVASAAQRVSLRIMTRQIIEDRLGRGTVVTAYSIHLAGQPEAYGEVQRVGTLRLGNGVRGHLWEVVVRPMMDSVCIARFVVADDGADMWNFQGEVLVAVAQYIDGAEAWNGMVQRPVQGVKYAV